MRDDFQPVRDNPSQKVRRSVDTLEMRRMADALASLLRPTVHGPGQLRTSVLGAEITVPGRPFWAQITGKALDAAGTTCYTWAEQWDDGAGNFATLENGRSGSAATLLNQAYEANANPVVPVGKNVIMWLSYDALHYEFSYCCGTSAWVQVTSLTLSVAVHTITITGATGGFWLVSGSAVHLAFNATAAAVQVVLRAVTGALVVVTGSNGGPYTVTWPDNACHVTPTLDGSSLTGSGTPTIAIVHTTQGGYYPGQYGVDDETPCTPDIELIGGPGDVWVRTSTGNPNLRTGVWYRGDLGEPTADGKPVYVVTDGLYGITVDGYPSITTLNFSSPLTDTGTSSTRAISVQNADATHDGVVDTTTQTFGGLKLFPDGIEAGPNQSGGTTLVAGVAPNDDRVTVNGDLYVSGTAGNNGAIFLPYGSITSFSPTGPQLQLKADNGVVTAYLEVNCQPFGTPGVPQSGLALNDSSGYYVGVTTASAGVLDTGLVIQSYGGLCTAWMGLPDGDVVIGNGGPSSAPLSGDATMTSAGVVTLASVGTPGTYGQVTTDAQGRVTAGAPGGTGTVTSVDVDGSTTGLTFTGGPVTSTGTITLGGTLGLNNGGTGANLSGTGPGYLYQATTGAAVTVSATAPYTPASSSDWNGTPPTTLESAVDRCAALLKVLNGGTGP